MRRIILYLFIALIALGAADAHLKGLETNDNHEADNRDSLKTERYLSERTSLEHLEEV